MSNFEIYDRPGRYLSENELNKLHQEILCVARESLDEIPNYQCLSGKKDEYARLMIAVARAKSGEMLGFCSSYILETEHYGSILHLGLTCVSPKARRMGLTHKLTSKVVMTYLVRYSLFKRAWISNVACVLSSLGNVALHFEEVFPSPFMDKPSETQMAMARIIDRKFRWELYISPEAIFNEQKFVFERSVIGTVFEKAQTDKKYLHRDQELNQFYIDRLNFSNGDEVLQIGRVSLLSFPKYLFKLFKRKFMTAKILEQSQTIA